MTREEAIKVLEEMSLWKYCEPEAEAAKFAITALREQEEYEIQRQLKHFDIKEPRPEAMTKCHDLYDEDGGEILEQESLAKKTSDKKTSEWISVEERLPEEAERVLVRLDGDKPPIGEPRMDTDRVVDGRWVRWNELVTHWMPLPEPPEVEA